MRAIARASDLLALACALGALGGRAIEVAPNLEAKNQSPPPIPQSSRGFQ
jgi:hypothetical protein